MTTKRSTAGRRGVALRRITLAAVAAGAAVASIALGAVPAGADSSSSAGQVQLGGYNIAATASGLSVFYEQPNFPIPATPSLEMNLGYSNATYDSGPVATGNGSAFWPGPVIAGGASQLPLLLNPYLEKYAPQLQSTVDNILPTNITYPVDALCNFPQTPNTASNNNGPLSMDSTCGQSGVQASSAVGQVGGTAAQSALPAGMLSIQAIASDVQTGLDAAGNAVSTATSTLHGVSIGGGLIQIGTITSTATSTSDGNQAKVTGTSSIAGASILGEPVSIDSSGVHVTGQNAGLLGSLLPSVNQALSTLGITITLNNPIDTLDGASGIRQLDGLNVDINFSTFDQGYQTLYAALPSQLKNVLIQLPIPTPYKQDLTLDLGWVNVNSAASPAFNVDLGGLDLGAGTSTTAADNGLLPTGSIASLGNTTGSGPSGSSTAPASQPLASAPSLFKGLGGGLIALGVLLALGIMGALMWADRSMGATAAAPLCIDEENPNRI